MTEGQVEGIHHLIFEGLCLPFLIPNCSGTIRISNAVIAFSRALQSENPCPGLLGLWLESNGPGPSNINHQLRKHNHCARPALPCEDQVGIQQPICVILKRAFLPSS